MGNILIFIELVVVEDGAERVLQLTLFVIILSLYYFNLIMTNKFFLPIEFNDQKREIQTNLLKDLELLDTDTSKNAVYENIFDMDKNNNIIQKFTKFYTTDINFLNDTQKLNKKYINKSHQNNKINNI